MKVGALIPARFGSKRIFRKNIKPLNGKPLLFWTIDTLLEAGVFDAITVSTESPEVASLVHSKYCKSEVSVLKRPEELSRDASSLDDVFLHYLEAEPDIDIAGIFLPTYPFRNVEKLIYIDRQLRSGCLWRVSSMSEEKFCTGDFFFPKSSGLKRFFDSRYLFCHRYNSCYFYKARHLALEPAYSSRLEPEERQLLVTLSSTEDIDIDTPSDFEFAEKVASGMRIRFRPLEEYRFGDWILVAPEGVDFEALIDFVGRDKFKDLKFALLVLESSHHNYARFLHLKVHSARPFFISLDALKYMQTIRNGEGGFSQNMPEEFKVNSYYRMLRTPGPEMPHPVYNGNFSVRYDLNSWADNNGLAWGTRIDDPDITVYQSKDYKPLMVSPSILPWERTVMIDDLKKQPFYVDPIYFE